MPNSPASAHADLVVRMLMLAKQYTHSHDTIDDPTLVSVREDGRIGLQIRTIHDLAQAAHRLREDFRQGPGQYAPYLGFVTARLAQTVAVTRAAGDALASAEVFSRIDPAEAQEFRLLARDLLGTIAQDYVAATEQFALHMRRAQLYEGPVAGVGHLLSPQLAALRAVAMGKVTAGLEGGRPIVEGRELPSTASTFRLLETKHLIAREECPAWQDEERLALTLDGCRTFASALGRPSGSAPSQGLPPPLARKTVGGPAKGT